MSAHLEILLSVDSRSWLATGRALFECAPALEMGIEPTQVEGHLVAGMSVAAAVEWIEVAPAAAVRWAALEFSYADMRSWISQGRTLPEAEHAAAAAGSGRWLTRWARMAGRSLTVDELAAWAAFGPPVGVWGEIASRGFSAADVPMWTSAGFAPVEVLRFAHLRVPLHEAIAWRDERFTAYDATNYLGVGITLADACALTGLPVRQVQEAWPRCGSVAAVRELLAS